PAALRRRKQLQARDSALDQPQTCCGTRRSKSNKDDPDRSGDAASYADRPTCRILDRWQCRLLYDRGDHDCDDHGCRDYAGAGPCRKLILRSHTLWGYISDMRKQAKASCLRRLSRIEGQVRGVARMVERDRYCIDVITQIGAVRAALRRVE